MRSYKRIDNLEFRWVDSNYYPGRYEIVFWTETEKEVMEICQPIACWYETHDGFNLKFIGNFAFDERKVNPRVFWELAKFGDRIANAEFHLEKRLSKK